MEWLIDFAKTPWVKTLAGLIILDIILGVAAALKRGEFDWAKLSQFYRTMILPMGLGFGIVALVAPWLVSDLLGEYSSLLSNALKTLAWAVLVRELGASILGHFKEIFGVVPESPDERLPEWEGMKQSKKRS